MPKSNRTNYKVECIAQYRGISRDIFFLLLQKTTVMCTHWNHLADNYLLNTHNMTSEEKKEKNSDTF